MKRKSNPLSLISIIFIIGVISSFISSDFEIGSLFANMGSDGLESTLDLLNLGLGFLAIVLVAAFFIFRSVRRKDQKDQDWEIDGEWRE